MANSFPEAKNIATKALPILENNLVMAGLVHRELDSTFGKEGDTIQVRVPASFDAVDFDGDLSGEYQDVAETSVDVKLDKIADVSVVLTSKELSLNVDDFTEQVTKPALVTLAQKIDAALTGLYKDIPYFYGTSGTTPDELKDISYTRKVLNGNKVPLSMRKLIIDPESEAEFSVLDQFANSNFTGNTQGLTEAALGRKLGFDIFMDQNIKTHTAGTYTALADVTITSGAAGATTIELTSAAGASTGTLVAGDLLELDGNQYVVVTGGTAIAGVISPEVYPAIPVAFGDMDDDSVTFADQTAGAHTANMAFVPNAFALVSRPMAPAMGGANSAVAAIGNGISIRVTMGYDMDTKKNKISYDVLYGVKTLYKELAAIMLG